jgi:hypothetical protein
MQFLPQSKLWHVFFIVKIKWRNDVRVVISVNSNNPAEHKCTVWAIYRGFIFKQVAPCAVTTVLSGYK